jgi:parallel beta-helix repeat protein
MLTFLLIGMLTLAFNVQPVRASGTIYIKADGSIDPPTAPISTVDNVTYTFTDNITDNSIVIERSNIIVDGAGYTLQGTGGGSGTGINLTESSNVTVKNMEIKSFYHGIGLYSSGYNTISGNTITNNSHGVFCSSMNNIIIGNNITANIFSGIWVYYCSSNIISGNNIASLFYGLRLSGSSSNNIIGNNITANRQIGIEVLSSMNNIIIGNNITANRQIGIEVLSSMNNIIIGNNITANNGYGIELAGSSNNKIRGNNITNNHDGIGLYSSSNNEIYHNNFVNNPSQVSSGGSPNTWDDGYPSGGNYWSNYNGTDFYHGPHQNLTGSDGIGDTPYIIDANNVDRYPLMNPYPVVMYNLTITTTTGGTTNPAPGTHTYWSETVVSVTAIPHTGYGLDHWELDGTNVSSTNPYSVLMDNNHRLRAVFVPAYTLTITTTADGTTNPSPGSYVYNTGTSVSVTAIPDTYYRFDHWELDGINNSTNPINVTMDSDHTLHAVFVYDVTIKAHCYTEGVDVTVSITMDGSPTGYTTPHIFTNLTGTHMFKLPDDDANGHPFEQWNTGEISTTVTVTSGETYTAYYVASGTIYIRADGLIDPKTARISTTDNITYTFTDNINNSTIVVEKDNIVLDGEGYALQGPGTYLVDDLFMGQFYPGLCLESTKNVTIKNIEVNAFDYGIFLYYSSNNSISGNNITNNGGIYLEGSSCNSMSGNNITNNGGGIELYYSSYNNISVNNITTSVGIELYWSSSNSISGNTFTGCGLVVWYSYRNSVVKDTVNGKPLVYLEGVVDYTVGDAGQVILVECDRIKIENLNLSRANVGMQLWETDNSTISGNNITNNNEYGIFLYNYSSCNSISGNNITNNGGGIDLADSSNNSIYENNIIANGCDGITLGGSSSGNSISRNNIINNNKWHGMASGGINIRNIFCESNKIFHNNFVNNSPQVMFRRVLSPTNVWDDGYPSGGNYWSDYAGVDAKSGPNQDLPGSDNIGDTPYIISIGCNNLDHYPLMNPYGSYSVTIDAYCITESKAINVSITMDGNPTVFNTPHTFTGLIGTHTFTVSNNDLSGHPFKNWNTGETTPTITVSSGGTYTAYYEVPLYDVTIAAHCNTEGTDVSLAITKDGSFTGFSTPHTFTGLTGTHTFTVSNTDASGHLFSCWSTSQKSTTITVTSGGTYIAYYGTRPAVGGVVILVDKFVLLAPYIGLASIILFATVATAVYVKRVKRRKEKQ